MIKMQQNRACRSMPTVTKTCQSIAMVSKKMHCRHKYNPEQRLFAKLGRQRHFTCKRITTAEHKITCKTSADQVIDRIRNMILIFKCAEHWKLWFAFWGMLNP